MSKKYAEHLRNSLSNSDRCFLNGMKKRVTQASNERHTEYEPRAVQRNVLCTVERKVEKPTYQKDCHPEEASNQ